MEHSVWTMQVQDLMRDYNQVKGILLDELERQNLLRAPAKKLKEEWAFIVHKPSWLGKTIGKLMGGDQEGSHRITLVKVLGHAAPETRTTAAIDMVKQKVEEDLKNEK